MCYAERVVLYFTVNSSIHTILVSDLYMYMTINHDEVYHHRNISALLTYGLVIKYLSNYFCILVLKFLQIENEKEKVQYNGLKWHGNKYFESSAPPSTKCNSFRNVSSTV